MVLRGSVYSNTLDMETGLSVITPNDYGQAERYRVCYVLHGLCGGNGDYSNYTMLPYFAYDKDILFLCPEVQRSFYANTDYGMAYFSFVCDELPRIANLIFNISAKREDTAILGGSMGGYGALKCALTRPDRFGTCGAFAPAPLYLNEWLQKGQETGAPEFPDLFGIFGKTLTPREADDLPSLLRSFPQDMPKPALFLTVGKDDPFLSDCRRFRRNLQDAAIPFSYEEIDGGHDFYAFNAALRRFIEQWN